MKDFNEIAQELFERREQYISAKKKRRRKILGISISLICICLVGSLGTAVFVGHNIPLAFNSSSPSSHSYGFSSSPSPSVPSNDISISNDSTIIAQQAVLKLQYNSISDMVLDLRGLVGVEDEYVPGYAPSGNLTPGSVVSSKSEIVSSRDNPDGTTPSVVISATQDDPSQEWDEPFQNPQTQEENKQKQLWNSLFSDGDFYAPTLGAGNERYQLYQLNVSMEGLCYYYVDMLGSNNPDGNYDLMVRIPLENSDVILPNTSNQTDNQVYALIEKEIGSGITLKFYVVRAYNSNNHFLIYWTQNNQNYVVDYYGSSDYNDLEQLVALLVIQGHSWN